tara:strand:+ start:4087 stop:4458 length:372 start_codon:yes stop_codon:yes gene_type:complete
MTTIIEQLKKAGYKQTAMISLYGNASIYRTFDSIEAGKYRLSCQGSESHYCSPREYLSIDRYNSLEVAVFNSKGKMINIAKSSVLRKFPQYDELLEYSDGYILAWLPVELLDKLFNYLKNYKS